MKLDIKKADLHLEWFKNLPWLLASRAFLAITVLILVAMAAGGFLYWQYVVLTIPTQEDSLEKTASFRYNAYKQALEREIKKQENLEALGSQQYQNPFARPAIIQNEISDAEPQ